MGQPEYGTGVVFINRLCSCTLSRARNLDWLEDFWQYICFLEASWIGKIKSWFLQWITEWRSHFVNFVLFSAAMADLDDLSHVSFTRLDCWVGGFKDVFWCTPKMNGLRLGVKVKLWIDLFFVVRKTMCFPLSRDPLFDVSSFVILISVAWDEDFKPLWKPRSFRPLDDWTWGGSLRFSWSAWCFMESFPERPNAEWMPSRHFLNLLMTCPFWPGCFRNPDFLVDNGLTPKNVLLGEKRVEMMPQSWQPWRFLAGSLMGKVFSGKNCLRCKNTSTFLPLFINQNASVFHGV